MNGCEHAVEYVYHYLDEEITLSRRMRIRWHLRRCDQCCGAFDFERRLKAVIRDRGRAEPPPELFETLRALIREEGTGPSPDA
jgi:mycothiol system anti-sigma-R factor